MENFRLKRIKLLNGLGLEVTYCEKLIAGDATHWIEKTIKSTIQRHPDIDKVADRLRIHVIRVFGMLAIGMYKPEEDFNKDEKKLLKAILGEIEITSITLAGDSETTGALISAKKKVIGSQVIALNTPNIAYENNHYDQSWDLKETIDELRSEVFEYVFNRKSAQLDMFADKAA